MSYTPTTWTKGNSLIATKLNRLEKAAGDINMSYTPHTWTNGEAITAARLNALEQGIAEGSSGSSDFSTAEMTVTNGSTVPFSGNGCILNDEDSIAIGDFYVEGDDVINLILYKGSSQITLYDSIYKNTVALAGDVEGYDDIFETNKYKGFTVTGDCTITISQATAEQ